jgi:hypothetical protein
MGKPVRGIEGRDSESKEQCELEVYLETFGGQDWLLVAWFFSLQGTKEADPESLGHQSRLQNFRRRRAIATHPYVTAGLEADWTKLEAIFPTRDRWWKLVGLLHRN